MQTPEDKVVVCIHSYFNNNCEMNISKIEKWTVCMFLYNFISFLWPFVEFEQEPVAIRKLSVYEMKCSCFVSHVLNWSLLVYISEHWHISVRNVLICTTVSHQNGKLLRQGLEHLTLRDVGETSDVESEMLPGRPDEGVKVMQRIVGRWVYVQELVQTCWMVKFGFYFNLVLWEIPMSCFKSQFVCLKV